MSGKTAEIAAFMSFSVLRVDPHQHRNFRDIFSIANVSDAFCKRPAIAHSRPPSKSASHTMTSPHRHHQRDIWHWLY